MFDGYPSTFAFLAIASRALTVHDTRSSLCLRTESAGGGYGTVAAIWYGATQQIGGARVGIETICVLRLEVQGELPPLAISRKVKQAHFIARKILLADNPNHKGKQSQGKPKADNMMGHAPAADNPFPRFRQPLPPHVPHPSCVGKVANRHMKCLFGGVPSARCRTMWLI